MSTLPIAWRYETRDLWLRIWHLSISWHWAVPGWHERLVVILAIHVRRWWTEWILLFVGISVEFRLA